MSGFPIPLPEEMAAALSELPLFRQRIVLEQAINQALDSAGWPRDPLDTAPTNLYWYVMVTRCGVLLGNVGPILGREKADQVAASWRTSGHIARVGRAPVGRALTNAHD